MGEGRQDHGLAKSGSTSTIAGARPPAPARRATARPSRKRLTYEPVGCVELAMTHRSASRCVFATHPTCYNFRVRQLLGNLRTPRRFRTLVEQNCRLLHLGGILSQREPDGNRSGENRGRMDYISFSAHLARISCRKSLCHIRYRYQFARLVAKTGSSQPLWTQKFCGDVRKKGLHFHR